MTNICLLLLIYEKHIIIFGGSTMDTRQLRYFATIVQEGQITRAAKKLNMAQPPLSQQLRQMEEELGTTLLERNGRHINLTEAGKTLYTRALEILDLFDTTVTEIKESGEGLRGTLQIGTLRSYAYLALSKQLYAFHRLYPKLTYKVLEGDPSQLIHYLQDRRIEFAITRAPLPSDIKCESVSLHKEKYLFIVPKQWVQYQSRSQITMKELQNIPILLNHRSSGVGSYEAIMKECLNHGFHPNIICECQDFTVLLSLVSSGLGATIQPKSTSLLFQHHVHAMEIIDISITGEILLIWPMERILSKAASTFIEMIRLNSISFNKENTNHH